MCTRYEMYDDFETTFEIKNDYKKLNQKGLIMSTQATYTT